MKLGRCNHQQVLVNLKIDANQTQEILYSPVKVVAQLTPQRRATDMEETPVVDTKLLYICWELGMIRTLEKRVVESTKNVLACAQN